MSLCDVLDAATATADGLIRFQALANRGDPARASAALSEACRAAFAFKALEQRARTILATTAPIGPHRDPHRYQPANDHGAPPEQPDPVVA